MVMRLGATRNNTKSQQWGPYDGYFWLLSNMIYRAEYDLWVPVEFSIDGKGRFAFTGDQERTFKSAVDFIRDCTHLKARHDNGPRSMVQCALRARARTKKRITMGYEMRGKAYILELSERKAITISHRKGLYFCWAYVTNQRRRHAEINGIEIRREHSFGEAT